MATLSTYNTRIQGEKKFGPNLDMSSGGRQGVGNGLRIVRVRRQARAHRVREATGAAGRRGRKDDVIIRSASAERVHASRDIVPVQRVAQLPSHDVISARGVATDTQSTLERARRIVQAQATAKDVDSTNLLALHVIAGGAPVGRIAIIRLVRIHGIRVLQSVQEAVRLSGLEQVGRRKGKGRQAERRGSVGLLGGDHAGESPLCKAIRTAKDDLADGSVTIHNRGPHVVAETVVVIGVLCHDGL